jgi:hypothetical protein
MNENFDFIRLLFIIYLISKFEKQGYKIPNKISNKIANNILEITIEGGFVRNEKDKHDANVF